MTGAIFSIGNLVFILFILVSNFNFSLVFGIWYFCWSGIGVDVMHRTRETIVISDRGNISIGNLVILI